MNIKQFTPFVTILFILIMMLIPLPATSYDSGHRFGKEILQVSDDPLGVAIIDDLHDNDYSDGSLVNVIGDLESRGYIAKYSSDFPDFASAVSSANYLIITAPSSAFSQDEIDAITDWLGTGAKNLLLASRGDFEDIDYDSINNILQASGATVRVQDDNVYTTVPPSGRPVWWVGSTNFNSQYPDIFEGVTNVNLFSPSSVTDTPTSEVLIYGEPQAYQTNQNGDPPAIVYDDTDDDVGGDSIPLAVIEEVNVGNFSDQIMVFGTAMWSDFDYGDVDTQDAVMFGNIMHYFTDKILSVEGVIPINLPDLDPPRVKIDFPHDSATLKGIVQVTVDAFDAFGVDRIELFIDGVQVGDADVFMWDTTAYNEGSHALRADVYDEAGNMASTTNNYVINQNFVPQVDDQTTKVLTYNIARSGEFPEWLDVMKEENADIAILVETGDFENDNNELLNSVTSELNDYFFDEINYQSYTLPNIGSDFDGITLLSRFDIIENNKLTTLTLDDGGEIAISHAFMHSAISVGGQEIHIVGAHLPADPGDANEISRLLHQESIINYMDDLGDVPIIYAGDMNSNSEVDSRQNLGTEAITALTDNTHPSSSKVHEFIDVHVELNPGVRADTYIINPNLLSRIDYIFVNQWFASSLIESTTGDTVSGLIGSDHASVDVIINFTTLANESQSQSSESNGLNINFGMSILMLVPLARFDRVRYRGNEK